MRGKEMWPARFADRTEAGKPYRPSNGTEGDAFAGMWCDQCRRDADYDPEQGTGGCSIRVEMMAFLEDEPEYPKQLVHDTDGQPICTAFVAIDAPEPRPADLPGQIRMF